MIEQWNERPRLATRLHNIEVEELLLAYVPPPYRLMGRKIGLPLPPSSVRNFGWKSYAAGYASQRTAAVAFYGTRAEHKEEVWY